MNTIQSVMTKPAISVGPDVPLREVAAILLDHRISGLPVVDDAGTVLGVVSEADFLVKEQGPSGIPHRRLARIRGESGASRSRLAKLVATTAGEAMTSPATTVPSRTRISEAAGIMTTQGINRLPVVDDGQLVGIVTRADLVRAYVRSDAELARTIRDDVLLRILWLDPALFTVDVTNGVAAISGRVELRSTAEMVEGAVGMVPGLVDVHAEVTWSVDDSAYQPASLDLAFPYSPR